MDNINEEVNSLLQSQKSILFYSLPFVIGFLFNTLSKSLTYIALFLAFFVTFNSVNNFIVDFSMDIKNSRRAPLYLHVVYLISIEVLSYWILFPEFIITWKSYHALFWETFYIVTFGDFMIKAATMILKCLALLFLMLHILPLKHKGNIFYMLESISQLFRCVFPTVVWCNHLYRTNFTPITISLLLAVLYLCIKFCLNMVTVRTGSLLFFVNNFITRHHKPFQVTVIYMVFTMRLFVMQHHHGRATPHTVAMVKVFKKKLLLLKNSWMSFSQSHKFITPVDCEKSGSSADAQLMCPICHFDVEEKVQLPCEHVFCKSCCLNWFDIERYCPKCFSDSTHAILLGFASSLSTQNLANDKIPWKSGETDEAMQMF